MEPHGQESGSVTSRIIRRLHLKPRLKVWLPVLIVAAFLAVVRALPGRGTSGLLLLSMDRVMQPAELASTGVANLTPAQRVALDKWLNAYTARLLKPGESPAREDGEQGPAENVADGQAGYAMSPPDHQRKRGMLVAAPPKHLIQIPFHFVDGLIVCDIPSSKGPLRLIFDTGANGTALQGEPKSIDLKLGFRHIRMVPVTLRTNALVELNVTLAPGEWLEGILGQDVMCRFKRITIDYEHMEIDLET